MSKVLKFIVHFVVICTILCVVALAVPPFFGVTTEIRDSSETESNLSMGSVTYAIPVKSDQIAIGDAILAEKDGAVYRLNISYVDLSTNSGTAVDATVSQAEPVNISFGDYMPKVVVSVPLIGYLMVATQSVEGMIILGLAVLFLVILYIIAELWKKDADDDYEEEDTEPGYVKSKKELKAEERRRARRLREEEEEIRSERKASKKKPARTVRTGGFVDEIEEDDEEDYDDYGEEPEDIVQTATSEAHEVLKKEIAAATAEKTAPVRKKKSQTRPSQAKPKKAPTPVITEESEEDEEDEPIPVRRMAIPRMTADQLLKKAKKAGDNPDVYQDEITGVSLLDYSDLFTDGNEEDEE